MTTTRADPEMIPEPRIEQLLLAGEKAACLRVIQPELRLLLSITEFGMLPLSEGAVITQGQEYFSS